MSNLLSYLVPRIRLRDLPIMLGVAGTGAMVAGVYGVLHDQVTYTISPEYFTKLKFQQFAYANWGFSDRHFVAEIGFLATWWVGFLCAWFLARRLVPGQSRLVALRQIRTGFVTVASIALCSAAIGYGYGLWRGPLADDSSWSPIVEQLEIDDSRAFVQVAYIHNASYLGGLFGLIVALFVVRPRRMTEGSAGTTSDHSGTVVERTRN